MSDIVTQINKITNELMNGGIELHCHVDPEFQGDYRSQNAVQLAETLKAKGMRGAVLKSLTFPSTGVAYITNKIVEDFTLYGSIVLNKAVGGLNPDAVSNALIHGDGAKIVWFSTISSYNHIKFFQERGHVSAFYHRTSLAEAITVLENNKLKPEAIKILELIAQKNVALATGHLSPGESMALVKEAKKIGVKKIIITHPIWEVVNMNDNQMEELVKMGAYLEICAIMCEPHMWSFHKIPLTKIDKYVDLVKKFGAEHMVLSTDLGNSDAPIPAEGLRTFLACLLESGVSQQELEFMIKKNPAKLLGLD